MKRLGLAVAAMLMGANMFSQALNLQDVVDSKYYDELTQKKRVINIQDSGTDDLVLLPESKYKENFAERKVKKAPKNFPFVFEGLFLLDKQELLKNGKSGKQTVTIEDVSEKMRSFSQMEGMKYYSTTRKKEMVLYKKAYGIKSAEEAVKISDENTGNADGKKLYALLDDSSFGKCRYVFDCFQSENTYYTVFTNLDDMGIGPFKAIYPGNIQIHVLVIDCGENLLLYLATDLDSVNFPGIKGQISDSIISRMNAVHGWFIKQF